MIVDVQMCKTCFKDMAKPTIVVQDNMMILRLRTLTQHIFSRIKTNLMGNVSNYRRQQFYM